MSVVCFGMCVRILLFWCEKQRRFTNDFTIVLNKLKVIIAGEVDQDTSSKIVPENMPPKKTRTSGGNSKDIVEDEKSDSSKNEQLDSSKKDTVDSSETVSPSTQKDVIQVNESIYTSTEVMKNFEKWDKTIEVILYVADTEAAKKVGNNQDKVRFHALLSNTEIQIQLTAWDDKALEVEEMIKSNSILHIENLQAEPAPTHFNKGQLDIELVVTTNTTIESLGRRDIDSSRVGSDDTAIPLVLLKDAATHSWKIRVQGCIRAAFKNFTQYSQKGANISYGIGSLTDGIYKLPLRITNFNGTTDYRRGDVVEIVGVIQPNMLPISLVVDDLNSVKKVAGTKLTAMGIIKGGLTLPVKRKLPE